MRSKRSTRAYGQGNGTTSRVVVAQQQQQHTGPQMTPCSAHSPFHDRLGDTPCSTPRKQIVGAKRLPCSRVVPLAASQMTPGRQCLEEVKIPPVSAATVSDTPLLCVSFWPSSTLSCCCRAAMSLKEWFSITLSKRCYQHDFCGPIDCASFQYLGDQGEICHVFRDARASASSIKETLDVRFEAVFSTTPNVKVLPTEVHGQNIDGVPSPRGHLGNTLPPSERRDLWGVGTVCLVRPYADLPTYADLPASFQYLPGEPRRYLACFQGRTREAFLQKNRSE